jgi:SAM-dependent methyltransferase
LAEHVEEEPMTTEAIDLRAATDAFAGRALTDLAGMMATLMCVAGDRLGLFARLAEGPATSAELAERAGVDERYAREWLRGMTAAGYLTHDRADERHALPAAHAPVLADEGGPMFMGGVYQEAAGALPVVPQVVDAFRRGGGVAQASYGADFWAGLERFTGAWFDHLLVPQWLESVPDVRDRLRDGARVADIGCGAGRALIRLAEAFPASTFTGYDLFPGQVERARRNARAAGMEGRVSFEMADAAAGIPGRFDVITTFDVVHDAAEPERLVRGVREALEGDGAYLLLEINSADDPADNVGPLATAFYGFSLFYCMTTSLAQGGAGLGTCGLPEARVRELLSRAGFGTVERAPFENPFNVLYVARP